MHLSLALCLICSLLNTLQVPLVPSNFRSLPFHLFRDLFLEFLCVVQLPTRMSDGCFDGHKLWFLRKGNVNSKRLEISTVTVLTLSSNALSAFFILFSAFATAVRILA